MARAQGYSTQGDVLVNRTADRIDLNVVWDTIRSATEEFNRHRSALSKLLCFPTTDTGDAVPQSVESGSFEKATEFGVPVAARTGTALPVGYDFGDYDRRGAFTWRFLRGATAKQIYTVTNDILTADNKLVSGLILRRLFDNTPGINEFGTTVYSAYNGDAQVPPSYLGNSFTAPHTHYLPSGSNQLDSSDIEMLMDHVTEHSYGVTANSKLLILCNRSESQVIQSWRAGIENANTAKARFDFVPSALAPAFLTTEHVIGTTAPDQINGLPCYGSYGPGLLIESAYIPAGWVAVVATGGPDSNINPIALREHENPAYRGLRHIPGPGNYPLTESFSSDPWELASGIGVPLPVSR